MGVVMVVTPGDVIFYGLLAALCIYAVYRYRKFKRSKKDNDRG